MAPEVLERFWAKVEKTDSCWVWTSGLSPDGYGKFKAVRKTYRATRFIWEATHGPIAEGLQVLHDCDNRLCVRPDHLHLGTHKQNMAEAAERARMAFGEHNPNRKLSEAQAREIFLAVGKQRDIAKVYGVSQGTVFFIKSGRNWSRLDRTK